MENFDKIDGSIKKKIDGMEFPFSEANWEKARQMIDANRPIEKQRGSFLLVASIVTGTALLISGAFYFLASSSTEQPVAVNTNNPFENVNNTNVENNTSNINTSSIEKNIQTNSAKEITSAKQSSEDNTESSPTTKTQIAATTVKEEKVKTSTKNHITTEKTTNYSSTPNKKTIPIAIGTKNTILPVKPNQQNNNTPVIGEIENAKLKTATTSAETKSEPVSNKTTTENLTNTEVNTSSTNENKSDDTNVQNTEVSKVINAETKETNVTLQPDTANNTILPSDYVKTNHHEFNIEGGVNNSFGWIVNNKRNGNSLSPLFGINYIYHLNEKSSILIGAQYNSISNLSESNVSFSVTTFDFGVNNDVTTYKVTDLQYIVMPLKYIHQVGKSSKVGVGLNATYLLNIKNKIETFKTIESNVQIGETKTDMGYGHSVTSNYNAQLALSYHHCFSKKLGLNVELNKNLMNVFNNYSFFNAQAKSNKPIALKLSLTYSLFYK